MVERSKINNLNDNSKINLYFALEKAYEDIKNYEKSFHLLKKRMISQIVNFFIIQKMMIFYWGFTKFFSKKDIINHVNTKNTDKIIFILGLPRSGTSLAEQIISSHSKVYGAGELNYLENIIKKNFL